MLVKKKKNFVSLIFSGVNYSSLVINVPLMESEL